MKKFVLFILCFYPTILFAGLAWAISYDINNLHTVMQEMNVAVNDAHNYCVKATQDIEGLQQRITANATSRTEYERWLTAMSNMQKITIDEKGLINTAGTGGTDDTIFKARFLKKLEEEKSSSNEDILTPLNFSITYLDRSRLQEDARWYMYQRMRQLNDRLSANQYGLYTVDPMTLDVKVSLTATPINLLDITLDSNVREQYLKLFGSTPPAYDSLDDLGLVSQDDRYMANVFVKYDITYYVYYDYIPTSFFFKTNKNNIKSISSETSVPPHHIYFPFWFDRDGNLNPDEVSRTSTPVMKLIPSDYMKYEYSYILTN